MTYIPTTWVSGSLPAVNDVNLNKIEQGIRQAHEIAETDANETTKGRVQFANASEVSAGTNFLKSVSPGRLSAYLTTRLASYLQNLGGVSSIAAGDHDDRPSAGSPNRVYISTDSPNQQIARDTGSEWVTVASLSYSDLFDKPTSLYPGPHAITHELGGDDEISAADIGAAPLSHVGASGAGAHPLATTSISGFMSSSDKLTLQNHVGAGGPAHPIASPSAAGFMSASDKSNFDSHMGGGGAAHALATGTVAGFMSAADKSAFTNHLGVGGSAHPAATGTVAGFMSATDKVDLGDLKTSFTAHVGSGGAAHANATTSVAGFLSPADKTTINNHPGSGGSAHAIASQGSAGFMSATDKQNLDEVDANFSAHQGAGGAAHAVATSTQSGFMSAADKVTLNSVQVLVGEIKMWPGVNDPSASWMICNGRAISRTTYAALFNVISTRYGVGDGSTTFNIPDFRSQSPVGANPSSNIRTGYTVRELGVRVGAEEHVLTIAQMPRHSHFDNTGSAGSHSHTADAASGGGHTHTFGTSNTGSHSHGATTSTGGSHGHVATVHSVGDHSHLMHMLAQSQPIGNGGFGFRDFVMHPFMTASNASWHVFTDAAGGHNHGITVNTGGSHNHTLTTDSGGSHSHGGTTDSGGSHDHSVTVSSGGGHSHSIPLDGLDDGHNNMQPSLTVNFIIRVAA